jgi:hypothetical protein
LSIHGTDVPSSIGYARSQGCIRLRSADVERLFEQVREGDVVELHAEQTPEIAPFFAPPHSRTAAPPAFGDPWILFTSHVATESRRQGGIMGFLSPCLRVPRGPSR